MPQWAKYEQNVTGITHLIIGLRTGLKSGSTALKLQFPTCGNTNGRRRCRRWCRNLCTSVIIIGTRLVKF